MRSVKDVWPLLKNSWRGVSCRPWRVDLEVGMAVRVAGWLEMW